MTTAFSLLSSLKDMQAALEADVTVTAVAEHNSSSFALVTLSPLGEDSSSEMLLEVTSSGEFRVAAADTFLMGDTPFDSSGLTLASLGLKGVVGGDPPDLPPSPIVPDLSAAEKIGFVAEYFLNSLSSKRVPGTNNGRLACGWSTNYVVRVALGAGIGAPESMKSTIKMFDALRGGRGIEVPLAEAGRGDVIISPTQGTNTGHVGILLDGSRIANNSSSFGLWMDHKTKNSWHAYYVAKKGLGMHAFRLD